MVKTIDLTPNWRRAKYKDLVRAAVAEKTGGRCPTGLTLRPPNAAAAAIEDLKLGGDIAKPLTRILKSPARCLRN